MLRPSPIPHFEQTKMPDGKIAEVVRNPEHELLFVPNKGEHRGELNLVPFRGGDKIYLDESELGDDAVSVMQEYMEQDQNSKRDFIIKTLAVRFLQAFKDNLEAVRFFNSNDELAKHIDKYRERNPFDQADEVVLTLYTLFNRKLVEFFEQQLDTGDIFAGYQDLYTEAQNLSDLIDGAQNSRELIEIARQKIKDVVQIDFNDK